MISKRYTISMNQLLLFVLLISFFLAACTKQNVSPTMPVKEMVDTSAVVKHEGNFINGPYGRVRGNARIYNDNEKFSLLLDSLQVSNGPDLHVYLSKQVLPVNF